MSVIQPHLDFLMSHLLSAVFVAFLIEGAGVPFPSRIILILAATALSDAWELARLVLVTAAGALIGDHVPYLGGKLAGPRLLTLYCRMTLGSERCVERTVAYFKRFGTAAIVLSRFSTSIRLFASALSGFGHITYRKFIVFDVIGTLVYASLWGGLGFAIGDQAEALLDRYGHRLLLVAPVAGATLLGYRLWRRSRYGPARPADLKAEEACAVLEPARR